MAGKTSKFMVGLFVTMGAILGVVAIILVGATKYFEKGNKYVTYFDESVQGLQRDSIVKYRGVDVGRVERIGVAPDNKLISVLMKVNLKEDLPRTAVAQLRVTGITGLVFVELDRRKPDEPDMSPKLGFPSEYPVIPSRPSEVQKILAGVNMVVEKFNQIDTQGVFDQLKSTAAEIEIFFRGKRMDSILAKVEGTATHLQDITQRVDKMLAAGRLEEVLVEARDALKGTRTLMAAVKDEMREMNLREAMGQTRAITSEVRATSENLRQASETLDSFLGRINDRPSDLLFGKPPRKRWNE
jgi:phospholipid/cholesterol/gamma-HCH transport system substrate-binding protein